MKRKGSSKEVEVALRYRQYTELRKQGLTFEVIGKLFGYDHSTVSYGVKMYNQNPEIYDKVIEKNNAKRKATPHD